jgi:transposase InsO family protein
MDWRRVRVILSAELVPWLGSPGHPGRYRPREKTGEEALRERIKALAQRHPRYGCPRITVMLHREGRQVNKKRVHRLWKEEGLQIRGGEEGGLPAR